MRYLLLESVKDSFRLGICSVIVVYGCQLRNSSAILCKVIFLWANIANMRMVLCGLVWAERKCVTHNALKRGGGGVLSPTHLYQLLHLQSSNISISHDMATIYRLEGVLTYTPLKLSSAPSSHRIYFQASTKTFNEVFKTKTRLKRCARWIWQICHCAKLCKVQIFVNYRTFHNALFYIFCTLHYLLFCILHNFARCIILHFG